MSETLNHLLRPIDHWLSDNAVEDVAIQEPNVAWIYAHGTVTKQECELSARDIEDIAIVAAAQRQGDVSFGENPWPLLMTDLEGRARLAAVMPPCVEGCPSLTFRRGSDEWPTLKGLTATGLFKNTKRVRPPPKPADAQLLELYLTEQYDAFLALAVRAKKSIVMCGPNAAGKTHVGKALIGEILPYERLITVQNANELRGLSHPNRVQMFIDGNAKEKSVGPMDLVEIALRMRIGRLFLNEIRTPPEMLAYLTMGQIGHAGSITSIHAPHCEAVFDRAVYLIKQAPGGASLDATDVRAQLRGMVDIVAHCSRDDENGFAVDEILYIGASA